MMLLLYANWWFLRGWLGNCNIKCNHLCAHDFVTCVLCVLHWFLKGITEAVGGTVTVRLIIIVFVCMMLLFIPCKVFHQFKGS